MPYSSDLAIIDDTASTNIYGLALELIAVVDQDKHTQILSFGFLEDKSYHGFFSFFQDFKELTNDKKFRIIIIDRLSSQINALKDVFKESVLVFCHTHIRRNLVNSFGINSGIVKNFDNLENSYLICENYIKFLIEERKKNDMDEWIERIKRNDEKQRQKLIKEAVMKIVKNMILNNEDDEKILKYADITQNELEKIKRKCK